MDSEGLLIAEILRASSPTSSHKNHVTVAWNAIKNLNFYRELFSLHRDLSECLHPLILLTKAGVKKTSILKKKVHFVQAGGTGEICVSMERSITSITLIFGCFTAASSFLFLTWKNRGKKKELPLPPQGPAPSSALTANVHLSVEPIGTKWPPFLNG